MRVGNEKAKKTSPGEISGYTALTIFVTSSHSTGPGKSASGLKEVTWMNNY